MATERTVSEGGVGGGNIGFASAVITALSTAEVPLVWHPGTTPFVFKAALIQIAPGGTQEWADLSVMMAFWTQAGFAFVDPPDSDGNNTFFSLQRDSQAGRARSSSTVEGSLLLQRILSGPIVENFQAEPKRIDTPTPELRLVEFSGGALTNTYSVNINVGAVLFG